MPKKKRTYMQRKDKQPIDDVSVTQNDSSEAQRMLAVIQSIIDTGTYPCPECGTLVDYIGENPVMGGMHFRCSGPDCKYEGIWGI